MLCRHTFIVLWTPYQHLSLPFIWRLIGIYCPSFMWTTGPWVAWALLELQDLVIWDMRATTNSCLLKTSLYHLLSRQLATKVLTAPTAPTQALAPWGWGLDMPSVTAPRGCCFPLISSHIKFTVSPESVLFDTGWRVVFPSHIEKPGVRNWSKDTQCHSWPLNTPNFVGPDMDTVVSTGSGEGKIRLFGLKHPPSKKRRGDFCDFSAIFCPICTKVVGKIGHLGNKIFRFSHLHGEIPPLSRHTFWLLITRFLIVPLAEGQVFTTTMENKPLNWNNLWLRLGKSCCVWKTTSIWFFFL